MPPRSARRGHSRSADGRSPPRSDGRTSGWSDPNARRSAATGFEARVVLRDPLEACPDHGVIGPGQPRHRRERQLPVLVSCEEVDLRGPRCMFRAAEPRDQAEGQVLPRGDAASRDQAIVFAREVQDRSGLRTGSSGRRTRTAPGTPSGRHTTDHRAGPTRRGAVSPCTRWPPGCRDRASVAAMPFRRRSDPRAACRWACTCRRRPLRRHRRRPRGPRAVPRGCSRSSGMAPRDAATMETSSSGSPVVGRGHVRPHRADGHEHVVEPVEDRRGRLRRREERDARSACRCHVCPDSVDFDSSSMAARHRDCQRPATTIEGEGTIMTFEAPAAAKLRSTRPGTGAGPRATRTTMSLAASGTA